jgi:hypothetical protein
MDVANRNRWSAVFVANIFRFCYSTWSIWWWFVFSNSVSVIFHCSFRLRSFLCCGNHLRIVRISLCKCLFFILFRREQLSWLEFRKMQFFAFFRWLSIGCSICVFCVFSVTRWMARAFEIDFSLWNFHEMMLEFVYILLSVKWEGEKWDENRYSERKFGNKLPPKIDFYIILKDKESRTHE